MPTFRTPEPILVEIDLAVGDVTIAASDRTDTVVTVTPTDPDSNVSVEAAQRVQIDHSARALEIKQSLPWYHNYSKSLPSGFVTITVEVPSGSRVHGETALGTFSSKGRLGDCDLSLAYGEFRLDEVDTLHIKGANGNVVVQRAHSNVDVKTSTGNIRIAEVRSGTVSLTTAVGAIEIGVRQGSAANLDARTKLGRVRNALSSVDRPSTDTNTVKIRARTNLDDIVVRQS
jgi:DUF4097 and DUF4098 domain-containing protein YvlB